jgi:hypothetical protein
MLLRIWVIFSYRLFLHTNQSITGVADQINTSGWKSGVYVINAVVGKKKFSKKIVIK